MSGHQQDLSDTALFCSCLCLGRLAERQSHADRDRQLAISHPLRHELQRFSVEFREYEHSLYGKELLGVLWNSENRCEDAYHESLLKDIRHIDIERRFRDYSEGRPPADS